MDIATAPMPIKPPIIKMFCGYIPIMEVKKPLTPKLSTKKATVYPIKTPFNIINIGIKNMPGFIKPNIVITITKKTLLIIEAFKTEKLLYSLK